MTVFENSKADVLNPRYDAVDKEIFIGQLTTAERDALVNVKTGAIIYNTSTDEWQGFQNPSTWRVFTVV